MQPNIIDTLRPESTVDKIRHQVIEGTLYRWFTFNFVLPTIFELDGVDYYAEYF